MDDHRMILLESLRKVLRQDVLDEVADLQESESFPIFILFEGEIFGLVVPVNIFYRSYERLLKVSHDRRIAFQGKPLTDLELMIFQTTFDESLRLIRIAKGQIRRFEWPARTGKSKNDPFKLSLGLSATVIDFKLPDISFLRSGSPSDIAEILCWEHPRTIALILSHLENRFARNVLERLPHQLRAELPFEFLDFKNGRNQELRKQIKFTEFLAS